MTFNKVDISLPNDIKDFYGVTPEDKQAELHADFKDAIHAAKINFEKVSFRASCAFTYGQMVLNP